MAQPQPNRRQELITIVTKFNLYSDEEELSLIDQLLATRIYIISFSLAIFLLIIFTGLTLQTRIITVNSPSVIHFKQLISKYPLTLSCICNQSTTPHKQFIRFNPQFHQVCSSEFITQKWILSLFNVSTNQYHPLDFRLIASAQFQVLALFCQTARQFVNDAIKQFKSSLLITKETLFPTEFDIQVAALVDELKTNTLIDFLNTDRILSIMMSTSHVVSALRTNFYMQSVPNTGKYTSFSNIYLNKLNRPSSMSTDIQDECSCEITFDCIYPSGFYNSSKPIPFDEIIRSNISPTMVVPGMQTGCLPRNSLLQSTLECFFDQACLDMIVAFTGALSTISPLNFTATPSHFSSNMTVGAIFDEMMVESWGNTSNFDDYFHVCAPSMCTYSYIQRLSAVYTVTTLVGLIGGLNTAFLIIAPLIVTFIIRKLQSKFCSPNQENNTTVHLSLRERVIDVLTNLWKKIKAFNMFRKTLADIEHGIYSTRIYVILLLIGVVILTTYSFITMHTDTVTIKNPTLEQFNELHAKYPTLSCPCQQTSMPTSNILTVQPVFHKICSSVFVETDDWLKYWPVIPINVTHPEIYAYEFRRTGATFFYFLQTFCNVNLELVRNTVKTFHSMPLFGMKAMAEEEFEVNVEILSLLFFIQANFGSFFDIFFYFNLRPNQLIIHSSTNLIPISMIINDTSLFSFIPIDQSQQNPMCSCEQSDSCTRPQGFHCQSSDCHTITSIANQTIPGILLGCYAYDSFLFSTLDCLYNQTCIEMLIDWRLFDYTNSYLPINLDNITAIDVDESGLFSSHAPLNDMIAEMFIEDWILNGNYTISFTNCGPILCTYTVTERYPLIRVITNVIGLLGGLIVIFRIFVPPSVKIIRFAYHYHRRVVHEAQLNAPPRCSLLVRVQQSLINLNMYETEIVNVQNQLPATRIYLLLLFLSIIIVSVFVGLTQQTHDITIQTPSESQFNTLYSQYPSTLTCPCENAAIVYPIFSNIAFVSHPLCSDSSSSWNVLMYSFNTSDTWMDFDTFLLVTQLNFLTIICEFIKGEIEIQRLNYVTRRFISLETVPQHSFELQMNSSITLFIDNIVNKLRRSLILISDTFHSNQLQNLYMTNWQTKLSTARENYVLHSVPVSYNNGTCICAAGMYNCSRPLIFKDLNNNDFSFPGIVSGCLPIDGLRQSTLECLFNETCVNQLNTLLNSSIPLLFENSTRFPPRTTQVSSLIDELFVESWVTELNYSAYFFACAPSVCRYSYVERNDILYILTTLLGLYGGLTVALRFLVWHGLRFFLLLLSRCYRRDIRINLCNDRIIA